MQNNIILGTKKIIQLELARSAGESISSNDIMSKKVVKRPLTIPVTLTLSCPLEEANFLLMDGNEVLDLARVDIETKDGDDLTHLLASVVSELLYMIPRTQRLMPRGRGGHYRTDELTLRLICGKPLKLKSEEIPHGDIYVIPHSYSSKNEDGTFVATQSPDLVVANISTAGLQPDPYAPRVAHVPYTDCELTVA